MWMLGKPSDVITLYGHKLMFLSLLRFKSNVEDLYFSLIKEGFSLVIMGLYKHLARFTCLGKKADHWRNLKIKAIDFEPVLLCNYNVKPG